MSDSDSNPAIPSWQKAQSDETDSQNTEPTPTPSTSSSTSEVDAPAVETTAEETSQPEIVTDDQDRLEVARRFLENDAVRHAPHEKKVEFLKSKGIGEAEIHALLGQDESTTETEVFLLLILPPSTILTISRQQLQKQPILMLQHPPKLSPQHQLPIRPSTDPQSSLILNFSRRHPVLLLSLQRSAFSTPSTQSLAFPPSSTAQAATSFGLWSTAKPKPVQISTA
jgi:hypothetical protein